MYAVDVDDVYGKRVITIIQTEESWTGGVFASKDFARCQEANKKIQDFIAKKTGTELRSMEFNEALNCFPKSKIEKLFPRIVVSAHEKIYSPKGDRYMYCFPYSVVDGKDYIIKDEYSHKWYKLKGATYGGITVNNNLEERYVLFAEKIKKLSSKKIEKLNF